MAGRIKWAVASQVSTPELTADVLGVDREPACKQVLPVAPYRLGSTQIEEIRITPFRRARNDDHPVRESRSLSAGALKPPRHR
jgi:hypothetical protein